VNAQEQNNSAILKKAGKVQVKALFTDYDGTLSPVNVKRAQSSVPPKTLEALCKISQHISVAIITTKDLEFVAPRTPFACAWATLGGLEITHKGETERAPDLESKWVQMELALAFAGKFSENGLTIELKRDSDGRAVAFSVDWRYAANRTQAVAEASKIAAYSETLSLSFTRYEGQPFFDVFPCPLDKGAALLRLKKKLGVGGGVLYLGDSAADNDAFREADLSVGVLHEESSGALECNYFVKAEELSSLLETLCLNGFCFDAGWPMIVKKPDAGSIFRRKSAH
jgi:HAD superfamily hydrolase (TIGR01484 family)